jgi:hypothetical protein
MFRKLVRFFATSCAACVVLALTGCGSGWTGEHKEAGPLPLSSPDIPIVRLVDKRRTFEQGEIKRLLWDEGNGPILAEDRVKSLLESIPKELNDRLHSTRKVPAKLYAPFRDTGNTDEYIFDTWGIVVSLNPDVLIVSVHERPVGPHGKLPRDWDQFSIDQARRAYLDGRIECIIGGVELGIYAGTLVPWSKEMHVFSTDPKVKNGRLKLDNNRAEVPLPVGKLVLVHHDDDIDVTRE